MLFNVNFDSASSVLKIGFGDMSTNAEIVKEVEVTFKGFEATGNFCGKLVKVNGPASLPVAMVIAHHLAHRFGAVACFDPKLGGYVVSITHDPEYPLGSIIAQ